MADVEIKDLDEVTEVAAGDIVAVQVDIAGTFTDRKITIENLTDSMGGSDVGTLTPQEQLTRLNLAILT